MPRLKQADFEKAIRDAKRETWVLALEETGPRPQTDEQAAAFRTYYQAKAAEKFP